MSTVFIFVVGAFVTLLVGTGALLLGLSEARDLDAGVNLPAWGRRRVDQRMTTADPSSPKS